MVGMQHHNQHDGNWSQLPPDLLQVICKNILDISDFVHFRAVCKGWRTAIHPSDYSQQPWLFHAHTDARFYILLNSTQWTKFEIPTNFKEKYVLGSSHGYMLIRDAKTSAHYLLNPITGKEIDLPPLDDSYCKLLDIGLEEGVPKHVAVCKYEVQIFAIILIICQIGDEKWTTMYQKYMGSNMMCTFFKSSIYITSISNGKVIDPKPGFALHRMTPPRNTYPFWQCRPCGNASGLLLLEETTSSPSGHECLFEIYLLNDEKGSNRWIKTNNIGDQVVFWTWTSCICWETNNSSLYKRNSVYYRTSEGFGRFDIENATSEILKSPPPMGQSWFLPSLV